MKFNICWNTRFEREWCEWSSFWHNASIVCGSRKYSYPQGELLEIPKERWGAKSQNFKVKDEPKLEFPNIGGRHRSMISLGKGCTTMVLRNWLSSQVAVCTPCTLPLDLPLGGGEVGQTKNPLNGRGINFFWNNTTGMPMRIWKNTDLDKDCTIIWPSRPNGSQQCWV